MTATPRVTIIPTLRYHDAAAAIDWLVEAFGWEKKLVVPGPDGSIVHSQLTFGNGVVMISSAADREYDAWVKPLDSKQGVCTQAAFIVVPDVDAHHERAVAAGAVVLMAPYTEPHGRGYICRDPWGQVWSFGDYDPFAS